MKNIRLLFLLSCIYIGVDMQAQTPECDPDRPILQRVSVDPLSGYITIDWTIANPQISPVDAEEFIIFWFEPQPAPGQPNAGTNHFIARITDPGIRSYTFDYDTMVVRNPVMPDPRKTTVAFTVAAEQKSPYMRSLRSSEDRCLQVNSKYDSCRAEITLYGHRYQGWQETIEPNEPLSNYRLMRIHGGAIPDEEIKVIFDEDIIWPPGSDYIIFHVVPNVNENETYTYYIEAVRRDGMRATSYRTTKTTTMPQQPSFIEAVGSQYNSEEFSEISFKIDPALQSCTYEFLRSKNPDNSFVPLGTFDIYGDTVLTDTKIKLPKETYYYKLEAWHVCKNKYTASSNVATALWLSLEQDGQALRLFWDPIYNDWSDAQYVIHRQIGNNPDEMIATFTDPFSTEYRDDLSDIHIDGDVCYWITAAPETSVSLDWYAISNVVCFIPESEIYIPNAFTPNDDGINDIYKPFFMYDVMPVEFMLYIYDRIGALVYQEVYTSVPRDADNNLIVGWNGNLQNGKPANEGIYVYYIKYRTARERLVQKRGTISLMRP